MRVDVRMIETEEEMRALGAGLSRRLTAGDVVLLDGELGAGKTTLVRGLVEALGYHQAVRSPTFNLVQTFPTHPPVMHADLYRVASYEGIGLEDYLDSHLCLIEWPDRAERLFDQERCWRVGIDFTQGGRRVRIEAPGNASR